MKYRLIIILSLLLLSFRDEDPDAKNIVKIANAFNTYIQYVHPQAIYLQLDKDIYYANEKIWYKAYLVSEPALTPDTTSGHLYVELIDPYSRIVQIERIYADPAKSSGSFYLADTIPEGVYQIRAYTNWMKNFGPEFYFSQNIEVKNPNKQYQITPKQARGNNKILKKLDKKEKSFYVGFFPEGGNLLEGIECRVAFKAENVFGKGVEVTGYVVDKNKNRVANFHSEYAGMGSFSLTPEKDNSYMAFVQFPDGSKQKMTLPTPVRNNVGIKLTTRKGFIHITMLSNKPASNDRPANEFILIGQVRNKIYFAANQNLLDGDSIFTIPKEIFPSGIVHFTLFNNRIQPVAERLHFINHNDFLNFDTHFYSEQDSVHVDILPEDHLGENEDFHGSVSVVMADRNKPFTPEINIITELLLTDDLPGRIENPSYYLNSNNPLVEDHTELLMLTHGWKRFIWNDIINGNYPEIRFPREKGITINGKITREIFEFPLSNIDVYLYILDEYNDEFHTVTDENGLFLFDHLYYSDTIDAKILARKPNGGKNLLIHLSEYSYDPVTSRYGNFFLTNSSKIDMKAYRKMNGKLAKEEMLAREKELDSIFQDNIYGRPDFVLWGKDIPAGYTNLLDAMKGRIPGVNITGSNVTIRGANSIMGSNDPLLLIDGVPTDLDAINYISVQDVDRIEVLKGPRTAMYGSRGSNGVIAIYTKNGMFLKKGEISFSMLGFNVIEHFYSPSEKILQSRMESDQLPLTLFWNPSIKLKSDESLGVSFPGKLPDKVFYVIFEGISNKGRPGYGYALFDN